MFYGTMLPLYADRHRLNTTKFDVYVTILVRDDISVYIFRLESGVHLKRFLSISI